MTWEEVSGRVVDEMRLVGELMKQLLIALVALVLCGVGWGQSHLYIEEHSRTVANANTYCNGGACNGSASERTIDVSAHVGADIIRRCPNAVRLVESRDNAEFTLHISSGSSILYNAQGEEVYVSPAHWQKTVAKDVCKYLTSVK
jgi:hypothetical protein